MLFPCIHMDFRHELKSPTRVLKLDRELISRTHSFTINQTDNFILYPLHSFKGILRTFVTISEIHVGWIWFVESWLSKLNRFIKNACKQRKSILSRSLTVVNVNGKPQETLICVHRLARITWLFSSNYTEYLVFGLDPAASTDASYRIQTSIPLQFF